MEEKMSQDQICLSEPSRCVIIVDQALPIGRSANAAAVIALTIGTIHPELAGTDLVDRTQFAHPGLIPIGISILGASGNEIKIARDKAVARGLRVVDFPVQGQQTNDYAEFGRAVAAIETVDLAYVGVGIYGPRKAVGKVVGKFNFLS